MVYLELAFKEHLPAFSWLGKIFSILFAIFTVGASIGGGNLFQGNQTFELLVKQFPNLASLDWLVGLILAFGIGLVIVGGVKRIGELTGKLVPFMCLFYCISCLVIIVKNIDMVPALFLSIFSQAFEPDAIWAGGFIGVLTQGVRRASFSNEAGIGSAAIVHAAAKTDKPVREGVVAMLEPFIDTHIVCTMTALSILITGVHLDPSLTGKGAAITAEAFASLGSVMPALLMIASIIFAYSTAVSWSYYGEKGFEYIFGRKSIPFYRIFYVCVAALGPVLSLQKVIDFADIMLLSMAFPNIIGLMLLSGKIRPIVKDYTRKHRRSKTFPLA